MDQGDCPPPNTMYAIVCSMTYSITLLTTNINAERTKFLYLNFSPATYPNTVILKRLTIQREHLGRNIQVNNYPFMGLFSYSTADSMKVVQLCLISMHAYIQTMIILVVLPQLDQSSLELKKSVCEECVTILNMAEYFSLYLLHLRNWNVAKLYLGLSVSLSIW